MPYELRTYKVPAGRMDDLLTRFRGHTVAIFESHGMHSVGYWIAKDDPNLLIYLLHHDGSPDANWSAFASDPRWIEVQRSSLLNGPLIESVASVYLAPVDFSPLQ